MLLPFICFVHSDSNGSRAFNVTSRTGPSPLMVLTLSLRSCRLVTSNNYQPPFHPAGDNVVLVKIHPGTCYTEQILHVHQVQMSCDTASNKVFITAEGRLVCVISGKHTIVASQCNMYGSLCWSIGAMIVLCS